MSFSKQALDTIKFVPVTVAGWANVAFRLQMAYRHYWSDACVDE